MLGDHIRALKNGRWTHAIDLGDQRVLFLVDRPNLAPADRLRRVYRPDFTAGASRVELVVHRERTYPAKAVVARAWSRFMDPSVVAMFADSEQFAAWCKIGRLPEVATVEQTRPSGKATRAAAPAKAPVKAPAKAPVKAPAKAKAPAAAPAKAPAKAAAPKRPVKKAAPLKAATKRVKARPAPKARAAAKQSARPAPGPAKKVAAKAKARPARAAKAAPKAKKSRR
jgi:hypothetical protein